MPAQGTWSEVFGGGPEAEEIFSAWHYARYLDQVAAAGQAEYNLPMYANAWLAAKPGTYPTGGPVAHMHDVWCAAAPHLAVLAPDIYVGEFKEVCAAYARGGHPLFVPEASRDDEAAAAGLVGDRAARRTGLRPLWYRESAGEPSAGGDLSPAPPTRCRPSQRPKGRAG